VDPKYGENYSELYRRHWWWRARQRIVLEILRGIQPSSGSGQILDVGCGDGLFFDRLLEFGNVEGIERDASLVRTDGPYRTRIRIAPFDSSFRPGKQYSMILMLDVLEHLSDPLSALCHSRRLLVPGGTLLCTVPAFRLLWTNHDVLNQHVTRYTKKSLGMLARGAGFEILQQHYLFQWLFPAKLVARMKEVLFRQAPSMPRIPTKWTNDIFFYLTTAEYGILHRLRVPFGSSLLIVARNPVEGDPVEPAAI